MTLDQPKNETQLLWFFILNHQEYGFEKIINIQSHYPDITAIRNGKTVTIELEYNLSNFVYHYYDYSNRLFYILENKCDIIFCWMKDTEIHEPIEVIALNEKLKKKKWILSG